MKKNCIEKKNRRSQVVDLEALAIEGWRLEQRDDEKGAGRASWADIERIGADLMVLVAVD